MNELFKFLVEEHPPKYDLIKSAIAHHRFVWIHPFENGNGRIVRMLTYAILIKQGFKVNTGRILNPDSTFCLNRNQYYLSLAKADTGQHKGILEWCFYMLSGLKAEIEKIDRLSDSLYLNSKIFIPAIDFSYQKRFLSVIESKILKMTVEKQQVQADDFKEISRQIRKLRELNLLIPEHAGGRKPVCTMVAITIYNNSKILMKCLA